MEGEKDLTRKGLVGQTKELELSPGGIENLLTHLSIIITKHSSFKDKEILRSSGYPKQPSNRAHTLKSYPQYHVMFDPVNYITT